MNDITIARWKRYGHDRGYATAADGAKLGWIDLKTGVVTIEAGADAASVNAALRAWSGASLPDPAPYDVMTQPALAEVGPNSARTVAGATDVDEAFATLPDIDPGMPLAPVQPAARHEKPAVAAWTDLAAHRPGQLVWEQAAAEWAASKDRSKFLAYGARVFNVHTDERAWRVGTQGEEYIGAKLDRLTGRGWHILHSVPVGKRGSDIDHVVIGPGGIFTVNTKNHRDKRIWVGKHQIRVNGHPVTYLRDARYEAERASKALSRALGRAVCVRPCIAILTGSLISNVTIKQQPDDVKVLTKSFVPLWFRFRSHVLSPDEVEAIYAVARRSDTWV